MAEKKEVRVSIEQATAKTIASYAEKHDLSVGEAVDKLVGTAASRLAALARYAKNNKEPKAPGKPRAKKAAAKKAAAKKAAAKKAPAAMANGAAAHA